METPVYHAHRKSHDIGETPSIGFFTGDPEEIKTYLSLGDEHPDNIELTELVPRAITSEDIATKRQDLSRLAELGEEIKGLQEKHQ